MKHIRTIAELIEFFGGDTALASRLDITQSAVAHWKIRQQIAAGWHLRLLMELRQRGATVDPHVFGMTAEHEAMSGLFSPDSPQAEIRQKRSRKRRAVQPAA